MSVKGLVFDFNGTLFFDSELHLIAFSECFTSRGMTPLDRDFVIKNIFGQQNEAIYRTYFNPTPSKNELRSFSKEKEGRYFELCRSSEGYDRLCTGAEEMLDYLKQNSIPYCIATGSEYENVEFYIEHIGLDRWFSLDDIVYTDGSFRGKPEPDIYRIAAARLGLSPDEIAVFEDGTAGLMAARDAGVKTLFAVHERTLPSPIVNGIKVCDELYDFSNWKEILSSLGLLK